MNWEIPHVAPCGGVGLLGVCPREISGLSLCTTRRELGAVATGWSCTDGEQTFESLFAGIDVAERYLLVQFYDTTAHK